jgi:integrase
MGSELLVVEAARTPTTDAAVNPQDQVAHFALAAHAPATRRAYAAALRDWDRWSTRHARQYLPALEHDVAEYLAALAGTGISVSSLMQRVAALAYAHRLAGLPSPTDAPAVRAVVSGARRVLGSRPDRKAPATVDALSDMLAQVPGDTLPGRRDRALLLLGFAGAFRRSELVAIDREHCTETDQGVLVFVPRSKSDQEGQGREVAILRGTRLCPVQALHEWLLASDIVEGPVFRPISSTGVLGPRRLTGGTVARLVKRYAEAAGLDPEIYSGHSLRAGFATAALDRGASLDAVARQLGHARLDTTRVYDRRSAFTGHAGRKLL